MQSVLRKCSQYIQVRDKVETERKCILTKPLLKKLSSLLADKWEKPYSVVWLCQYSELIAIVKQHTSVCEVLIVPTSHMSRDRHPRLGETKRKDSVFLLILRPRMDWLCRGLFATFFLFHRFPSIKLSRSFLSITLTDSLWILSWLWRLTMTLNYLGPGFTCK
jgi:hypothetical protein